MSDDPLVTHHAYLGSASRSVQTYTERGHVVFDANGALNGYVNRLSVRDARALAGVLLIAAHEAEGSNP